MSSLLNEYHRRLQERLAWEAENPELARLWSEAKREDHDRALAREAEERRALQEANIPYVLTGWGVPQVAIEALARPERTGPWVAAGEFIDGGLQFLGLLGRVGTGKTVAAARVLRWAARRGHEGAFERATTFARLSGYDKADRAWFERLCEARVVVLDDLSTEHLTEYGLSMFQEWLDRRASDPKLRTIITANVSKATLAERYGERIVDRLAGSGLVHVSTEKSLRRRPE